MKFSFPARMDKNETGQVTHVKISPTIDVDPVMLSTLSHTVIAMGNLLQFAVNKVKAKLEQPEGMDRAQWKEIR